MRTPTPHTLACPDPSSTCLAPVPHFPAGIPGRQQVHREPLLNWAGVQRPRGSAAVGWTVLSWCGQQPRAWGHPGAGGLRLAQGAQALGSDPRHVPQASGGHEEEGSWHRQGLQVLQSWSWGCKCGSPRLQGAVRTLSVWQGGGGRGAPHGGPQLTVQRPQATPKSWFPGHSPTLPQLYCAGTRRGVGSTNGGQRG